MSKKILEPILYVIVFLVVQVFVEIIARLVFHSTDTDATATVVKAIVSSIITIAVFAWLRWSPFSRSYLQSRPWDVVLWTALLAVGTVLPSAFLQEHLGMELPPEYEQIFLRIMNHPLGYLAVGILVPVAEEMVFRGAILRTLLHNGNRSTILAILVSALLFGACHGNLPQFFHATLIGLLLGWMYWRTGSIVPGIVFHWVNNTIAYVVSRLMPGLTDADLIDLCGGDLRRELLYVAFSLCIFLPALFQLHHRMKRSAAD